MPRSSSPYDDPFADLFGKLPDPRSRGGEIPGPRRTPAPEPGPEDIEYDYAARPATPRLTPFSIAEPIGGAVAAPVAMATAADATPAGFVPDSTISGPIPSASIPPAGPPTNAAPGGPANSAPGGPANSASGIPASSAPGDPANSASGIPASSGSGGDLPTGSAPGGTPGGPAASGGQTGPTPTGEPPAAPPLSRRAAREARASQTLTGETPTTTPPTASGPTPPPASGPATPPTDDAAGEASTDPTAEPADETPAEASLPATAILPVTSFDDLLAPAAAAVPAPTPQESAPAARESRPVAPSASLEDLFTGTASSDEIGRVPPPPNKRRRRVGGWIALGIVLLILGGVAAGGLWVWNTYEDKIRAFMGWEEPKDYEAGQASGEALVTISSGDTGSTISTSLYNAGVTKTSDAFYDMLVKSGQNPTFYPGVYKLQQKMTSDAALTALQDPANKLENSALLREGLTVDQILPIVSEGVGVPLADLQAAVQDPSAYGVQADSLEGWLFPAMYTFDPGATAPQIIQTMVDRTVQSLDAAGVPAEDRQRVLTIASIIQREARFEDDFYKVSRVIENRLDPNNDQTFGLLQMDSTAQYGYGEMHDGTVSSSQAALDDDNPWNTYKHPGLPKGPIANAGDKAIDAAMHPADGPWLYFVTVNPDTGETVFTTNVQDHEKAVKQWQEWCAANPGKC
ncbi:endolytic transglycosylase MltG [Microbacterium sp. B2969]|uniref:Endolytic murein transglycosylase n=1 Tax=Microbacterium alkaliflavum TaxID=3248839 RepID=A0ABW7Q544_9MICO